MRIWGLRGLKFRVRVAGLPSSGLRVNYPRQPETSKVSESSAKQGGRRKKIKIRCKGEHGPYFPGEVPGIPRVRDQRLEGAELEL